MSEHDDLLRRIEALETEVARLKKASVADRATLVVFSGEMDRLMAAFIIATGAAAMGLEVSMYFTYWGLVALKNAPSYKDKSFPEMALTAILPSGPDTVPTSKMNWCGLGPMFFKHLMKTHNVESLSGLIEVAEELEVKMVACQMSMGIMGIRKEELRDGLQYGGVATYLGDATDSKLTLFI